MYSADGKFHKTIQFSLRCRGDAPDAMMAKIQEVLRTKPPDASSGAAAVAPTAAVTAQPPNPPRPAQQQQQLVDENLLRQLADMVRSL